MTQEFREGNLHLLKAGPLGPFANNAYLVADAGTRDAIIVDAPQEIERLFPHLEGLNVRAIVITHRHGDHWAGIDALVSRTGAPVWCHAEDATGRPVARTLDDEETLDVGALSARVLFTPGHTPGSICLQIGQHLISGDTLFPGGPGRTGRPEDLEQEIVSITSQLYVLPESTLVHPGHGDGTTIGESRREYEVFASKKRPAGLCGDVTWLGS